MKRQNLWQGLFKACVVLLCVLISIGAGEIFNTPYGCRNLIRIFEDDEGNFSSPGGSIGYPNNSLCAWDVKVKQLSAKVVIIFHDFDLENSKTCIPYDHVNVTENCNGTWSSNIGQSYCGNRTRFNVTSTCGWVRITFKSDDSVTSRGFNVSYRVVREKKPPIITCLGLGCNRSQYEIAKDDVRLDCSAGGFPEPKIRWYKEGGSLPNHRELFNGSIRLLNVKMSDTGVYVCMANNSQGGAVAKLKLHVAERCTCPKRVLTNWYHLPPYAKVGTVREKSLFRILLRTLFQTCCGNCSGGHGPSEIIFDGPNSMKNSLVEVKDVIDQKDTISFPIPGNNEDREYQQTLKFVPMVSSPGVAFIVVTQEPGTSAKAVFNSVLDGWPILVLTLVMALLSGMIMWALDTWNNPDEFPRSFIKGSGEGFWWAFVTMTTVGYGDRSPRGFFARIFAIIWVLVGLVITSIFTGVVTTSLTAITLNTDTKLYGAKIVAIKNSTEYRLGLNKNAKMTGAETLVDVAAILKKRDVKGALVDTYVAGEVEAFQDTTLLRVSKIIDYSSHYGIVFGDKDGPMSEDKFQTCLNDYVLTNKAQISKIVEDNTEAMKKPKESAAVEKSSGLFDSESKIFTSSVYTCLGLLLFLTACGLIWDYGYMRHWRKKTELEELEMLGGPGYEVAQRNMEMMDSLMTEVQEFYENWNRRLDDITLRHDEEQKFLAKHHK